MTYKAKLITWVDQFAETDLDPNDFEGALEYACEEALKTIEILYYTEKDSKEESRHWEAIYTTALQYAKDQTEKIISLQTTIAQLNQDVDRFEKEKKGELVF